MTRAERLRRLADKLEALVDFSEPWCDHANWLRVIAQRLEDALATERR